MNTNELSVENLEDSITSDRRMLEILNRLAIAALETGNAARQAELKHMAQVTAGNIKFRQQLIKAITN